MSETPIPQAATPEADSAETPNLVHLLSPNLDGAQRRYLRSLAHELKPVVQVGNKGVTDALLEQVEAALLAHELIRVKVHDREALDEAATLICKGTGCQLAQRLGKTLLLFRAHPATPSISLPGAVAKRVRIKVKKAAGSHGHRKATLAPKKQNRSTPRKSAGPRDAAGRRPRPGKKKSSDK
jgi:RNA-binding protein